MLNIHQLRACLPYAGGRVDTFFEPLTAAMDEWHVENLNRQASFLAQIAHESGSLRYTEELADGSAYEGRADLGNTEPGDGRRFRGAGLIQITGRSNTLACLKALGRNESDRPYLLTPEGASRSAGWFWYRNGLNEVADLGNFWTISRIINGGTNGLDDRIKHYVRIRKVLGI